MPLWLYKLTFAPICIRLKDTAAQFKHILKLVNQDRRIPLVQAICNMYMCKICTTSEIKITRLEMVLELISDITAHVP